MTRALAIVGTRDRAGNAGWPVVRTGYPVGIKRTRSDTMFNRSCTEREKNAVRFAMVFLDHDRLRLICRSWSNSLFERAIHV
jgi:hypothetical protein